jgi:Tol biopolymer transport system component
MRLRYFIIAAAGLIVGLLVILYWMTPRVSHWEPAGNQIRANQSIEVVTNTPVRIESARSHFQITPPISGTLQVNGKSISFDPAESLEYGQSYTISLTPGLRGANGLASLVGYQKYFTVGEPDIVFMRHVDGRANLWREDPSGQIIQYTDEENGIWDYTVLPDGSGVLVSSLNSDGGEDLVFVMSSEAREKLLACGKFRCRNGHWRPDGRLVAYERTAAVEDSSSTEVWLLDTTSGETRSAHELAFIATEGSEDASSRYPRWSADGRYLSYYRPDARSIVILDMEGGPPLTIPAHVDAMGDWSPASHQLVYTELDIHETDEQPPEGIDGESVEDKSSSLGTRLKVADIGVGTVMDLSQGESFRYGVPVWEPQGSMIATGRASNGSHQLWTLSLDKSEQNELTDAPSFRHTSPSWSPDGRKIAYMLSGIDSEAESAAVWIIDLDDGDAVLVADDAFIPGWLP